ncbi:hypothetical protein HK099_008327 [Clydaea vesicula]|uniref:Uncharacterized protein n=1 Tax=Clydaea vesicula TaxID=447962 RepID=A0AAD5XXN2_9FUNG|nr:hypothetical protein HK099_008327 [Clydaea vesicula]
MECNCYQPLVLTTIFNPEKGIFVRAIAFLTAQIFECETLPFKVKRKEKMTNNLENDTRVRTQSYNSTTSDNLAPRLRKRISSGNYILRRTSSFGGGPVIVINPQDSFAIKKRTSSKLRWVNLTAYDNPAALNRPLQKYLDHNYDDYQYELNLFYSVYSFPNMFLPFIGGQLVDRLDTRKVLMAFRNKELAFALGLNLCVARLGSVMNSVMSPRIESSYSVPVAIWTGSLMCYLSFFSAFILSCLIAIKKLPEDKEEHEEHIPILSSLNNELSGHQRLEERASPRKKILKQGLVNLVNESTRIDEAQEELDFNLKTTVLNRKNTEYPNSFFTREPEAMNEGSSLHSNTKRVEFSSDEKKTVVNFLKETFFQIKLLPKEFWLICLICVVLYGTVVPFNNIASDFLMSKWFPGDTKKAGHSRYDECYISASLWDFGGPAWWTCNVVIDLFTGLSYSFYGVALWPSVATVIDSHEKKLEDDGSVCSRKLLGTAYGISTSALNTALTIFPLITAEIRVHSANYQWVLTFFLVLALIGSIACVILYYFDRNNGGLLQKPEVTEEED